MSRPNRYTTRQGQALLCFLKEHTGEHFTLKELCRRLEEETLAVGKSTVWRYLEKFCEQGLVHRSLPDGKTACYSYGCCSAPHYHLHCTQCHKIIHLDCPRFDTLKEHFLSEHGFAMDAFRTTVHGTCKDCREKGVGNA